LEKVIALLALELSLMVWKGNESFNVDHVLVSTAGGRFRAHVASKAALSSGVTATLP